jgi:hypothetical protein
MTAATAPVAPARGLPQPEPVDWHFPAASTGRCRTCDPARRCPRREEAVSAFTRSLHLPALISTAE